MISSAISASSCSCSRSEQNKTRRHVRDIEGESELIDHRSTFRSTSLLRLLSIEFVDDDDGDDDEKEETSIFRPLSSCSEDIQSSNVELIYFKWTSLHRWNNSSRYEFMRIFVYVLLLLLWLITEETVERRRGRMNEIHASNERANERSIDRSLDVVVVLSLSLLLRCISIETAIQVR